MKIAIFSDLHLGFGERTERYEESFQNAASAFRIAEAERADAMLIAGDIFDATVPTQETWERTFRFFPRLKEGNCGVSIKPRHGGERTLKVAVPVIAIHGTHEFRTKDYTNALQVLESAGCLIYVHAATAIIEKGAERIAIHGLGGIPEKKALDALKAWSPAPIKGMKNLLMLHQSLKEYLPVDDEMVATISLDDLPTGFDIFVDGHLHWHSQKRLGDSTLLIPGSTIITQMKKLEAEKPKGITLYDSSASTFSFIPLPHQRKLIYHDCEFSNATAEEVMGSARSAITGSLKEERFEIPPLVRVRLRGTLAQGSSSPDIQLGGLEREFAGKAVVSLSKDFFAKQFKSTIDELRAAHREKRSVSAMGLEMFEQNLSQTQFRDAFDARRLFELLADNRTDDAEALLAGLSLPPATHSRAETPHSGQARSVPARQRRDS